MLNIVVNGFWGTREEGPQEIAERWYATLARLGEIDDGTFHGWHEAGDGVPADPLLLPSVAALADYIVRENTGPDLDVVGHGAALWAHNQDAAKVTTAVRAGGSSPYITNSVSVSFRSRTVGEDADVIRRTPEILAAIGEAWDIDAGQVYDRPLYRVVADHFGLENSDPRCGRAVYLSERRAALAPDGLPGSYDTAANGGLIIDLTCGGMRTPSAETVIDVNTKLRAAGALEPLSTPFDRAKL
ncbi:Imm52 family immunity protein [Streptomyces sp. NPDC102402]|uniref:Imm52 family immunity protein n=1 Tax=Streptomyces sp. NPDC102402 TaxID=3366169 RepID=UPI00380E23C4